jgi:hypothetical protein
VGAYQLPLIATAVGFNRIDRDHADALLTEWGHYLGPCDRPFGVEAWVLEVDSQPISVAVSASIVSTTAAGYGRFQLVELARLCSHPDHRWATRPTLRLWREVAALRWPHWPVLAAIAYSRNARHDGSMYRFDGWTKLTDAAGSSGGGTWTKPVGAADPAGGAKTLWVWRYPTGVS